MLETVLIFAAITAAFELIVLGSMAPHRRQLFLSYPTLIHTLAFSANLIIHWGTVTGSMTAITAALASFATVPLARWLWHTPEPKYNKETFKACLQAGMTTEQAKHYAEYN